MRKAVSLIIAIILVGLVIASFVKPALDKRNAPDKPKPIPATTVLISAEANTVLSEPRFKSRLAKLHIRLQSTVLESQRVDHELRFNEYDVIWPADQDGLDQAQQARKSAKSYEIPAVSKLPMLAVTDKGDKLAEALLTDEQLVELLTPADPATADPSGNKTSTAAAT